MLAGCTGSSWSGTRSGVEVGDQPALQACDSVLHGQLFLLKAGKLELVDDRSFGQGPDCTIEVVVPEFKLPDLLPELRLVPLIHRPMMHPRDARCQILVENPGTVDYTRPS